MLPKHLQYLQETVNTAKLIRTKISSKVDHISFEIFPVDGEIRAFFMSKDENEVQYPSQSCGKTIHAKTLFNLNYKLEHDKKRNDVMNKIVKELQKSGANKLKIKSFVRVHDTSKDWKVS